MCQAAMHLEQTLPCMAQKSGFMSGSELATSGYSAFSALQAVSSVAQQFTIICGADSTNDCREFISCCLVQTEAPVLQRSPAQALAGEREPSSGINMYLSQCQRSCRPQLPGRLHQVDSQLVLCLKRIPQHHHAVLSCLQLRPVAGACTLSQVYPNPSAGRSRKMTGLRVASSNLQVSACQMQCQSE